MHQIVMSLIFVILACFGGFYAFRTLRMFYGTPEELKNQRKIWTHIVIAGGFFVTSGSLHFTEQILAFIPQLSCTFNPFICEFFTLAGLTFLALGIYRYWRSQRTYVKRLETLLYEKQQLTRESLELEDMPYARAT